MKIIITIIMLLYIFSCGVTDTAETKVTNELPYGMGFYITQNQIDAETPLKKFHRDCFIDYGTISEILWMGKGINHEPYQIIITSGYYDTLWVSPILITGYIECEREIINKKFDTEIEIFIKRFTTKYPIELYITTIINH